jgi:prolyl oligopeptidase PreP (S9A serine peptidase family)
MVRLSPGGSDASVEREFDTGTKQFVAGGFSLPEAKSSVAWRDADTLWVGTDFGSGSLTTSGYPRIVKLWKRGTELSSARTVFEGKSEDVASTGASEILSDGRYDRITRTPAVYRHESFLFFGDRPVKLDLLEDSQPRRSSTTGSCSLSGATGPSAARRTARARCSRPGSTTSCAASAASMCSSSRASGFRWRASSARAIAC